jgi:hypothetical protein
MEQQVQKPFYKKKWVIGLAIFFGIGLIGTIFDDTPRLTPTVTQNVQTTSVPVVAPAFDIPALVGKSVDEIKSILGNPDRGTDPTPAQLDLGTTEWSKEYERNGVVLSITYEISTGKVVDLFVAKHSENISDILAVGNLSRNDSRYSVELVKARNATGYTGAIVRAK